MNAILVIDKPSGITSHDVVNRVRRLLDERSVGHLGTLDPLATGVLPLVTGSFTRLAQFFTACDKGYEGVIRLGYATDTYDAQGQSTSPQQAVEISLAQARDLVSRFQGVIEQSPPPFSAKKINGVPAYKLARKHEEVRLKPVHVEVKEIEALKVEGCRIFFRATVTSGTYMRSIAHDLGQHLGCGAHLESLRRTALGTFTLADSRTLEELQTAAAAGDVETKCIHPRTILPDFPSVTVNDQTVALIRSGRTVNLPELSRAPRIKVFCNQTELIAIAKRVAGTLFHAKVVLTSENLSVKKNAGPETDARNVELSEVKSGKSAPHQP